MATAHDLITRALRKIGVAAQGETLTGEMASDGLAALNEMLHGWALHGADLGHTDLALADDVAFDAPLHEAVIHCLAARIAPEYDAAVTFDAEEHFRAVQAYLMVVPEVEMPTPLVTMPGVRRWWGR